MTSYLADTSAVVSMMTSRAHPGWDELATAGHIAICPPVESELAITARDLRSYEELQTYLQATFTWATLPDSAWSKLAAVQLELVKIGYHRGPSMADLLIALTAAEHSYTVLHIDLDFESIKKVLPIKTARADRAP